MADHPWQQSANLEKAIINKVDKFQYEQWVRLIGKIYPLYKITFMGNNGTHFPRGDIQACTINSGEDLWLINNFFHELVPYEVVSARSEKWETRLALKIYHRFYQLWYESWRAFQPMVLVEQGQLEYLQYLSSISGYSDLKQQRYSNHHFVVFGVTEYIACRF